VGPPILVHVPCEKGWNMKGTFSPTILHPKGAVGHRYPSVFSQKEKKYPSIFSDTGYGFIYPYRLSDRNMDA